MTRMRRSLYSMAAMYLNTGIVLVSGLIAMPLLLTYLGEERVGLSRVAFEWLCYTLLLGAGLDGALNVRFSKAASDADRATIVAALRSGLRAYAGIAMLSILWVCTLIAFTPWIFNLTHDEAMTRELRIALLVAVAGQFSMILGVFKPLADAEQRGYVCHLANAFGTFTGLATSIVLAYLGYGLPGQVVALMLSPALSSLILAIDGIRRYPEVLKRGPRLAGIHSINPAMLVFQLCGRIAFVSDCILVTLVLGTDPVAAFSITQRLPLLIIAIVNGLGSSTWAAMADLHHRGEAEAFGRRLLQLTRLTALLAAAALVPAAIWNGPFVRAWTGKPDLYAGDTLSLLTAAALTILSVVSLWGWPLVTTGRIRTLIPIHLTGTLVGVIVGVIATKTLGVNGPPLGTLANLCLVLSWWQARTLHREFGVPTTALLLAGAKPILLAIPYGAVLWLLGQQFTLDSFAEATVNDVANAIGMRPTVLFRVFRMGMVAVLVGGAAAAFLALAFATIIPTADRDEFLKRFRRKAA